MKEPNVICSYCHKVIKGITLAVGKKSYHPDCFAKTKKGKQIQKEFVNFLKNN
jgi:hypothetical protein